jgi:hypothetical protein
MPQAAQEGLVATIAVFDGCGQLVAGQLARVGERLPQLSRECVDLLIAGIGFGCGSSGGSG